MKSIALLSRGRGTTNPRTAGQITLVLGKSHRENPNDELRMARASSVGEGGVTFASISLRTAVTVLEEELKDQRD